MSHVADCAPPHLHCTELEACKRGGEVGGACGEEREGRGRRKGRGREERGACEA